MPEYTNAFIECCNNLKNEIQKTSSSESSSESLARCLHMLYSCVLQLQKDTEPPSPPEDWFEPLWFVYYMFFAIHNPKLEEYINRKYESANISSSTSTKQHQRQQLTPRMAAAHVLKNMIRRKDSTSTIVYQLFVYANIKKGAATYVYLPPKQHEIIVSAQTSQNVPTIPAQNIANTIIKSFRAGHLKTTAVHICKLQKSISDEDIDIVYRLYIDSILENKQCPIYTIKVDEICEKRYKIQYRRKDIIFLALVTYMHMIEDDINIRGVFISLTEEETIAVNDSEGVLSKTDEKYEDKCWFMPIDTKYKYLLS